VPADGVLAFRQAFSSKVVFPFFNVLGVAFLFFKVHNLEGKPWSMAEFPWLSADIVAGENEFDHDKYFPRLSGNVPAPVMQDPEKPFFFYRRIYFRKWRRAGLCPTCGNSPKTRPPVRGLGRPARPSGSPAWKTSTPFCFQVLQKPWPFVVRARIKTFCLARYHTDEHSRISIRSVAKASRSVATACMIWDYKIGVLKPGRMDLGLGIAENAH